MPGAEAHAARRVARLPGDRQGVDGRRRPGDAGRRVGRRARRRRIDQARREAGTAFGVPRRLPREVHPHAPSTSRSSSSATGTATSSTSSSATARSSGGTRRSSRSPRPPTSTRPSAGASATPPSGIGRHVALRQRRHGRVPRRRRHRPVLLHRGQPAHPGRAHRHRDRHRRRPVKSQILIAQGVAAVRPRDRPARPGGGADARASPSSAGSRPRTRRTSSRPTTAGSPTTARPAAWASGSTAAPAITGGDHHAVLRLAAGEGLRQRPAVRRRRPADGAGPPGVPRPGREDEHPVPAQRDRRTPTSSPAGARPGSSTRRPSCSSSRVRRTGRRSC